MEGLDYIIQEACQTRGGGGRGGGGGGGGRGVPITARGHEELRRNNNERIESWLVGWTDRHTVEPLYSGHHWTHTTCPDYRGVLDSEEPLYRLVTFGTRVSSL